MKKYKEVVDRHNFISNFDASKGGTFESNSIMESNINRVTKWIEEKEISGITGWRNQIENVVENCGNKWDLENVGVKLTTRQKKERNRELKASLFGLKYGVTSIVGTFWENYNTKKQREVIEESFLVLNLNDDPNFYNNLFKLGVYYNQDSILYKPKDSLEGYQVGTNKSEWPGYGNKISVGNYIPNIESEFMSRINNRGFSFTDEKDTRNDSVPNFKDRKKIRTEKEINKELTESFDLFWYHNNGAKYLITKESRPIIENLSLSNNGNPIYAGNFKKMLKIL